MEAPKQPVPAVPVVQADPARRRWPFAYDQDGWDLSYRNTMAVPRSASIANFDAFPPMWKPDVKDFIADAILARNLSNGWVQATLSTLRLLMRIVINGRDLDAGPAMLDARDARRVEDHARGEGLVNGRSAISIMRQFSEFLRERHQGEPRTFRPDPHAVPSTRHRKTYSEGWERVIPDEVSESLLRAVQQRWALLKAENRPVRGGRLRNEESYLGAIVLLLFSGRRISEILLLPRQCLRKPAVSETEQTGEGVWLVHHNTKTGSQFAEAFIPEPAAAMVKTAVERIQEVTEWLADASGLDHLFLTNARAGANDAGTIRGLTARAFATWLNGRMTEDGTVLRPGFIHRADIRYEGKYYPVDPHQARHTLAHKAYMGGAGYAQVSDHLGHRRTHAGISPMTGVYVHGEQHAVQTILEHADAGTLVGKAAPLVDNRNAVVQLEAKDIRLYQDQGLLVLPTHYGHCCLPASSGPCVTGDPCWIGPQGNGCDYALYSPESRVSLEHDRELLQQQVEDLSDRQLGHPRLGQLRARLERINTMLAEIDEALRSGAKKSPRSGIVPGDAEFEAALVPPTPQRRLRWRRRDAALRAGIHLPGQSPSRANVAPLQPHEWQVMAEALLSELEAQGLPLESETFERRLRIPVGSFAQRPEFVARLDAHNQRVRPVVHARLCGVIDRAGAEGSIISGQQVREQSGLTNSELVADFPDLSERICRHNAVITNRRTRTVAEESMKIRLQELQSQSRMGTYSELATLAGIQRWTLFHKYPNWARRLTMHNRTLKRERIRSQAEARLKQLKNAQASEPFRQFAKAIHRDPKWLRREVPDIVADLVTHNRRMGLYGAHVSASERSAFIHGVFEKAQNEGIPLSADMLADRCHLSVDTIRRYCPEVLRALRGPSAAEQVEAAWTELINTQDRVTIPQLANAAGVSEYWFGRAGAPWGDRIQEHNRRVQLRHLEETWDRYVAQGERWSAKRFAEEAGLTYNELRSRFPEWNARVVGVPTESPTRRRLEQLLADVQEDGEIVSPAAFAKRANVTYTTVLRHYPDIYAALVSHAKQFRPRIEARVAEFESRGRPVSMAAFCRACGIAHHSHLIAYYPDIAGRVRALQHRTQEASSVQLPNH